MLHPKTKWQLAEVDQTLYHQIMKGLGLSSPVARMLVRRNIISKVLFCLLFGSDFWLENGKCYRVSTTLYVVIYSQISTSPSFSRLFRSLPVFRSNLTAGAGAVWDICPLKSRPSRHLDPKKKKNQFPND